MWRTLRAEMAVTERWAYLDHAAVCPLPAPAVHAMTHFAQQVASMGDTIWPSWRRRLEEIRSRLGELLGVHPDEIAFVPNTTSGIHLIAQSFPWRAGENVVTLVNEFPSNYYPWLGLESIGVKLRRVEAPNGRVQLNLLREACDARTRIIAVSWVGFASGWRVDLAELAELAHRQGALLLVDAIQGLGVFPIDVQAAAIDFLVADGHKWMLGPEGAGVLYIRREHLDRLRPVGMGWNSVIDPFTFESDGQWRNSAARYEGGSHNLAGLMAWGASLDLLASLGWSAKSNPLADRVLELADYAVEQIQQRGGRLLYARDEAHRSGIVTFSWPNASPEDLRRRCRQAGVAVSARGGGLRVSAHAYNEPEELDRLFDALPG